MSGWAYLSIAIVLEVIATSLLKFSDGFTKLGYAGGAILLNPAGRGRLCGLVRHWHYRDYRSGHRLF